MVWDEAASNNMVSFDWVQQGQATAVNWLHPLWPTGSSCFYAGVNNIHPTGPVVVDFARPEGESVIAFGSECGTVTCSMTGQYANYESFYVR